MTTSKKPTVPTTVKEHSVNVFTYFKSPSEIEPLELSERQEKIKQKIVKIIKYMQYGNSKKLKYGGFLLHGAPQNGKSEIVKQVIRQLYQTNNETQFAFLDGASVAFSLYGLSERVVRDVFNNKTHDKYKVIFFDDIDCVLLGRQMQNAREYHASISSVLFHALDNIDKNTIFIATTNMMEKLDAALQTRLIEIEVPMPTMDELCTEIKKTIKTFDLLSTERKKQMFSNVKAKIVEGTTGYRDVQRWVLDELVNGDI